MFATTVQQRYSQNVDKCLDQCRKLYVHISCFYAVSLGAILCLSALLRNYLILRVVIRN